MVMEEEKETRDASPEKALDAVSAELAEKKERLARRKKRSRRVIAVLMGILFGLLVLNIVPGGREFFLNTVYSCLPTAPKTIRLSGTPKEMGLTHGKARSWAIGALCDIYVKRVLCGGDDAILEKRAAAAAAVFDAIDPRWGEELAGIAEGSGVDEGALQLGNTFLDLGYYRMGCREVVAFKKFPDGSARLLHAHNLDWDNLGGIGNFIVTIFRTERSGGRLATVRVGFPGMVGALTIINEKGVSLGFNQLGFSNGKIEGMPVFIAMRDIAETCGSFDEARKRILSLPEGMPFCITLADAKTAEAAVFERLGDGLVRERVAEDGIVTADNSAWCGVDMSDCPVAAAARRAGIFSPGDADMDGNGPVERLKGVLRDPKVLLGCNIYSVIFDFRGNKMYLAAGKVPAAKGTYEKYELFEKSRDD